MIESFSEQFDNWLTNGADSERLLQWLQGRGLPPVGYGDEPYRWLFRAIPSGRRRLEAETQLARACSEAVNRLCSVPSSKRNYVAYNLFMLCAGIAHADVLSDSLSSFLQNETKLAALEEDLSAVEAFRAALANNQVDDRLKSLWIAMLRRQPTPIAGTVFDGLEGVSLMPSATRGRPDFDSLREALTILADALQGTNDDCRDFARAVERVRLLYPGVEWDERLIDFANRGTWPCWAIESLPTLSVFRDDTKACYVWHPAVATIEPDAYVVKDKLCNGAIWKLVIRPEALFSARRVATSLDAARRNSRWRNRKAIANAIATNLSYLNTDSSFTMVQRQRLSSASGKVLQEAGINLTFQ